MPSLKHVSFWVVAQMIGCKLFLHAKFWHIGCFINIAPLLVNIDTHVTNTKYFGVVNVFDSYTMEASPIMTNKLKAL
jgi:hypothetical protein